MDARLAPATNSGLWSSLDLERMPRIAEVFQGPKYTFVA